MPLRRFIALFLLLAFACQTFSKALVIGSFYTARDAYARACENKARPQLHCNGRCQMMKKLRSEEKKEHSSERKDAKTEVLSAHTAFAQPQFSQPSSVQIHPAPRNECGLAGYAAAVFHPPLLNA